MATQYLEVLFDRRRWVYVDGTPSGFTNRKLRVEAGPHVVHLGEPENYTPPAWDVDLHGTSVAHPLVVEFERVGDRLEVDDADG